ncbi:MAG TPA: hypothetical protein PK573_02225 [Spirochaetota bacterium]|nr:hypothetical protein [Spirochaetota bacterium]HRZ26558.1 hypothetical protein [Spirochaetota bacterium]HSA16331.1 hypothetical protein [Spirochaetota bacterium]
MKPNFTEQEKNLLKAKNPRDYIDKSLKNKISPGRKAFVTRHWLDKTRYTIDDIKYARNRHPYWKAKKMEGTAERNAIRTKEHDYSKGDNIIWDEKLVHKFIERNKKDKQGKYIIKDWELAKEFRCTIPAIQHMRRKYNMAVRLIASSSGSITAKKLMEYLMLGESMLRNMQKKKRR